jgi:cell division protein FtsL
MIRRLFLYFGLLIIPFSLWLVVWNSSKYIALEQEILRIEAEQKEKVDVNRRLIADIVQYSASARIERLADEAGLKKIPPEQITQIRIQE